MINFDSLTLRLFCEENAEFFNGAKVQKIQQPSRNELVFTMRNLGETRKFYINFHPNFYHLCFMNPQTEQKRNLIMPKTAPMFCMLLRKYIQNSKIIRVEVPKYERIFEIYFEYYDDLNEKTQLCMAVELMGKYSNVILYNYDTNVIIGCAHNVSAQKSRERELYGMLPYVYPQKRKKKNLEKTALESFISNVDLSYPAQDISSKYYYLTIPMAEEIKSLLNPYTIEGLYLKLKEFLTQKEYFPYIADDLSKYFLFEFKNSHKCSSINEMLDVYYSNLQEEYAKSNLKAKTLKIIKTKLTKLKTLQAKQQIQIDKLNQAQDYKNKADIIMANLYNLQKTSSEAKLYDFEGNEIIIELDDKLSLKDNANKYYAMYKKTKASYEHASEMIEETKSQILYLEEASFFAKNADNIDDLEDIYNQFEEQSEKKEKAVIVDFIEYKGYKIFIGKNKKQNDYILSKLSSPEDIWFHPLNSAGAHILVKNPHKSDKIPDEVILKAGQITKEYSSQKNNSKTSIIYTKRKYVKKAVNKLAFVTYKNETEIVV